MLWVESLNLALEWRDVESVRGWMRRTGEAGEVSASSVEALWRDLSTLRAAFAAPHLGRSLGTGESAALSQWLEAVTLSRPEASSIAGLTLPGLCASRREAPLPRPLELLLSTSLVQLLAVLGDGNPGIGVERCHGLRRGGLDSPGFPAEDEARFAARAGLTHRLGRGGWHQCPRLVHSPRIGRYCGKACSNAAFAARKSAQDPRYFAAKQDRYRRRRDQPPVRPRPGAFVFLD